MPRTQRLILLGLAAVIVVVAVVVLASGGGGGSAPKTVSSARIVVRDAKPVGGVQTIKFKKGSTIDLTIVSDTADEVHFHGYDVHKDVAKGASVRFQIPARIEGKFLVELESHKQTLASVEVTP